MAGAAFGGPYGALAMTVARFGGDVARVFEAEAHNKQISENQDEHLRNLARERMKVMGKHEKQALFGDNKPIIDEFPDYKDGESLGSMQRVDYTPRLGGKKGVAGFEELQKQDPEEALKVYMNTIHRLSKRATTEGWRPQPDAKEAGHRFSEARRLDKQENIQKSIQQATTAAPGSGGYIRPSWYQPAIHGFEEGAKSLQLKILGQDDLARRTQEANTRALIALNERLASQGYGKGLPMPPRKGTH